MTKEFTMKLLNIIWACFLSGAVLAQELSYEGLIGVPPGPGEFISIADIAIGPSGNMYVLDYSNRTIQAFDSEGGFLFKFGEYGASPGQFKIPEAIAVDSQEKIYVVDSGNKTLQVFSQTGVFLKSVSVDGLKGGPTVYRVQSPTGVWADHNDKIYVCDITGTVSIFNSNLELQLEFGSWGASNGQLSDPSDIATDDSGNIYVVDSGNNRIQVFNPQGLYQRKFGQKGATEGSFDRPAKLAIDNSNNLYIADFYNDRVQVFSSAGSFINSIGSELLPSGRVLSPNAIEIGSTGHIHFAGADPIIFEFDQNANYVGQFGSGLEREGQITNPFSISVNPTNGDINILDITPSRVQTFDKQGNFLRGFSLTAPYAYQSLAKATGADGSIYVVDIENDIVHKYGPMGNYILSFGGTGDTEGKFLNPGFIVVGNDGNVYVSDQQKGTVQIFTAAGGFVKEFGKKGTGHGEFQSPYGIAFDNARQIYVVDRSIDRVQIFDSEGRFKKAISVPSNFSLLSVAVSPSGSTIYVLESSGGSEKYGTILNSSGEIIQKFGPRGYGELELGSPRGVVLDPDGRLIIAEWGNHRVQVLRVKKRVQTITFVDIGVRKTGDAPFEISAESTSGLPVNFSIEEGQDIAQIEGSIITLSGKEGNIKVIATQEGDSEFAPADVVEKEFSVVADTDQEIVTGLENGSLGQITAYPNPVIGTLKIVSDNEPIQLVEIINVLGERVKRTDFSEETNSIEVDFENQSSGLYYVIISTKYRQFIRRVVRK